MEFKAYKLSYYLNAAHSMDDNIKNAHAHTFIISLYLEDLSRKGFINFTQTGDIVNNFFNSLTGKYLNDSQLFQHFSPTIENMGSVFYERLKIGLTEFGYDLIQLDICENPLHVYSISDRLYLGTKIAEII